MTLKPGDSVTGPDGRQAVVVAPDDGRGTLVVDTVDGFRTVWKASEVSVQTCPRCGAALEESRSEAPP